MKENKKEQKWNDNKLKTYYLLGIVQAHGYFHIKIIRRGHKIYLTPILTIKLNKKDNKIIEGIRNYFNAGYYTIERKKYSIYRVTSKQELQEIILPFFKRYKLRNEKYINYLRFKVLCSKLNYEQYYLTNKDNISKNLLYLLNIAYKINEENKKKNKIKERINRGQEDILKYLILRDQEIIMNKKIYYQYLVNKELRLTSKPKVINIEFIKGLYDMNGKIKIDILKNKLKIYFEIKINDMKLLEEVQSYFDNKGKIGVNKYYVTKIKEIENNILPKFKLITNGINYNNQLYKISILKKIIKKYNQYNQKIKTKEQMMDILKLIYKIDRKEISKEQYIKEREKEREVSKKKKGREDIV